MSDDTRRVHLVRPGDRTPGPSTPGMAREMAFASEALWAGFVRTEPQASSGWHHHGDHETVAYVLSGALRFEFGPSGAESVFARPGDFVRVPALLVHRETTPEDEPCAVVIVRAGRGESTFNVEGPEPAGPEPA